MKHQDIVNLSILQFYVTFLFWNNIYLFKTKKSALKGVFQKWCVILCKVLKF